MAISNKSIITNNINLLIEASGLSDTSFADIIEISIRKLRYIKNGTGNLKLNDLDRIADFFGIAISTLSSPNIKIKYNLREKLFEKYKNVTKYRIHFEKTPTIVYAIKFPLLNESQFENPMEIKDIRLLLEKHKWHYRSAALSNALKRMPDLIDVRPHESKRNTNVYYKKNT